MKKIIFSSPIIDTVKTSKILGLALKKNFPNEGLITKIFENKIKQILNVKHVILTTSGTSAIYLALKANDIKYGDEVIIPNITFPATANAVNMTGAKVILSDVSKNNLLMDLNSLEKNISKKTKAILPVHISGRGDNIKSILKLARKYKIKVIEDAAEAFGSKNGRKNLGTYGVCGCFSLAPNKIITTGQGGIVVTNDKKLYLKIINLKNQGRTKSFESKNTYSYRGFNFKFTDLQASLGISQISNFYKRKEKLVKIYKFYKKNLIQNQNFKLIGFDIKNGELPLWSDVYCSNSQKLYKYLKKKKIYCRYFWDSINSMTPYKKSFHNLSNSKDLKNKLMWLPSSLSLESKELNYICNNINKYLKGNSNFKKKRKAE